MQVVHAQSVVLEWKLYPSRGPSFEGQNEQEAALPLPWWASATVHIDNPQISYTAKVNSFRPTPVYTCLHQFTPVSMLSNAITFTGE